MSNNVLKLTAEVTIDGKVLTDVQVMVLRAVVQAVLVTQKDSTLHEVMSTQLNEINRMLCGEET